MLFTTANPPLIHAVQVTKSLSVSDARTIAPNVQRVVVKTLEAGYQFKVTTPSAIFYVSDGEWLTRTNCGEIKGIPDGVFKELYRPYNPTAKPAKSKSSASKAV